MLQWGHDKIVMEVRKTTTQAAAALLLQWGHDKIVMEVGVMMKMKNDKMVASMGP